MFDIITDSACDLTPEMAQKMGVEVVPFYVSLDGEHYRKEGKEIAVRDFYQFMVDNPSAYPKTSLPSLEDFETAFRAHAEAGRPVLCICFTSKMSGCVGSARNARELVLEDYPDAKIEVEAPDLETVKRVGLEHYRETLGKKMEGLRFLLERCNDGRRKSLFCTAVNLLELEDVEAVIARLEEEFGPEYSPEEQKERGSRAAELFRERAQTRGVSLKLERQRKP